MKRRHMPSRWLIISFVVALMHLALLPQAARADEIDDMLAAGNYAKGEVIAAFFPQSGQLMREDEDSIIARANRYVDSYNQHVLS